MLLALGERAEIRYLKTSGVITTRDKALVHYWYTVTFTGDDGRKKTMIYGLVMERATSEESDLNPWWVKDFTSGIDLAQQGR